MSDYVIEYVAGGDWIRVSRDGEVYYEGHEQNAWAVADTLRSFGHSVEFRPLDGGVHTEFPGMPPGRHRPVRKI